MQPHYFFLLFIFQGTTTALNCKSFVGIIDRDRGACRARRAGSRAARGASSVLKLGMSVLLISLGGVRQTALSRVRTPGPDMEHILSTVSNAQLRRMNPHLNANRDEWTEVDVLSCRLLFFSPLELTGEEEVVVGVGPGEERLLFNRFQEK